jgi:hypothetical protein
MAPRERQPPGTRPTEKEPTVDTTKSSASAQDSRLAPEANPSRHCAGCGEPATRLAPLYGAKTGAELRALPLFGACCNPRIRPRNLTGVFEGL